VTTIAGAGGTGAGVCVGCRAKGGGVCAGALGAGADGVNPIGGEDVGVTGGAAGATAAGGAGNVGTTIPGGGAATAKGSSINSTGSSGSCSWKGDAEGAPAVARVAAAGGTRVDAAALSRGAGAESGSLGAGSIFIGDGAAALPVGIPTGFDMPANVVPVRRPAAALAAAAIFRAVAAAAGLIGEGATGSAGAVPPTGLATGALGAGAFVSPRAKVPAPFVPSIRAGAPASEAPNNISGSSSSPAGAAVRVGIRGVSGRPSGTAAATAAATVGLADESSKAPCESKSSPESNEVLFPELDETVGPMGSSTGRSARGSSLGREAASIVFEPESGGQSSTYPAMPSPRYLGDGSQIGTTGTRNVMCVTFFHPFPSR
jgi:hypothetical protein